jgi:hypothetical protein
MYQPHPRGSRVDNVTYECHVIYAGHVMYATASFRSRPKAGGRNGRRGLRGAMSSMAKTSSMMVTSRMKGQRHLCGG